MQGLQPVALCTTRAFITGARATCQERGSRNWAKYGNDSVVATRGSGFPGRTRRSRRGFALLTAVSGAALGLLCFRRSGCLARARKGLRWLTNEALSVPTSRGVWEKWVSSYPSPPCLPSGSAMEAEPEGQRPERPARREAISRAGLKKALVSWLTSAWPLAGTAAGPARSPRLACHAGSRRYRRRAECRPRRWVGRWQ